MSCVKELNEEIRKLKTRQAELECQIGQILNKPDTELPENSQRNDVAYEDNSDQNGTTTFGAFRVFVKGLVSQTSLHGLPNIANSTDKWVAVFWVVLLLVSTAMAGWQLVEIFTEYFRYPVITITEVYTDNKAELPEVTICNRNGYLKSKTLTDPLIIEEYGKFTDHFSVISKARLMPEELRIRLSHNITNFIKSVENSWSKTTYTQHPVVERGNCYSFLQTVYRNDASPFIYLEVNLNTKDYLHHSLAHEGFINLKEKGLLAPYFGGVDQVFTPGYRYDIFPDIVSVVRLNGKYANCQDDEEKFFEETGMKYSQKACEHICSCKKMLSECGCVFLSDCLFPNRYKISNIFANASDCIRTKPPCEFSFDVMSCSCKPRCNMKEYKISRVLKTKLTDFLGCIYWAQCMDTRNFTEKQEKNERK